MPSTEIYNFTSSIGTIYHINYDATTLLIETTYEGTGEVGVTEAELGVAIDTVLYQHCGVDFTLYSVRASITFPFAYLDSEPNSTTCGYVPPGGGGGCDLAITSVTVTPESVAGAMDGTAIINTTGGSVPNNFSLDAMYFQPSNVFTDLVPGTYIVYAANADYTCGAFAYFTIVAGAVAVLDTIPWTEKLCYFFKLIRDGIEYVVREPIKWDAVNIVGKRDKDWHGWSDQYSDGVLELEFDCPAGKDVIEAEYAAKGNDGEVFFNYGYTFNAVDRILFEGKLNLNTRKLYPQKVSCSVEKKNFNNLFQSRYETKVSMADVQTIDGSAIAAAPITSFTMHAKQIIRNYKNEHPELIQVGQTLLAAGDTTWFVQPDTASPQLDEIEDYFGIPLNFAAADPVTNLLYNWKAKYDGDYTFNLVWKYSFRFKAVIINNGVTIKTFFRSKGVSTQIGSTVTQALNAGVLVTVNIDINQTFNETLLADDEVYIWTELTFSTGASGVNGWVDQTDMNMTAVSLESAPETVCNGWFIFDAINQCIKSVTNNNSKLKSSFLHLLSTQQAADGDGSLYIVTNGKQIRQFETSKNPLKISSKDLLESVRAIFCLGLGYEMTGPVEVVRVERANYFYQNKQILVIEECWDYSEEVAKDIIYNEFENGYEKFQEDGFNTLDAFSTKHERVGPIKTNKLKLVQKSKLITDGYAIEQSRRQQFSQTATNSFQNDEDGFLIAMNRVGVGTYIPEKNENFITVDNLISPSTAYNLRISPLRMFLNWAIWLYNIFHYKPTTDKIKNTFVAQNGELITQYDPAATHVIGDINKAEWQEKQDILLSDYVVQERIYRPEWVNFKARLTPDKIERINYAMRGAHPEDINYGYLVVKDHNGDYQGGFIYELNYNYHTEQAGIKMLKKFDSPVVPGADCCNYLKVNGCFLLVNGHKIIV